jgi:hypothetical protein
MRNNRWVEAIGALFLIGAGLVLLLGNVGLLPDLAPLFWPSLLLVGGVLFLVASLADRRHWWALIPASGLIGVGLAGLLTGALHLAGEFGSVALFGSLALGFGGVYLVRPCENWWALIPGGAMVALAAVVLLSTVAGELAGAALFLGLGLVFVALYFAEIDGQRQNWWALIPAGALFSLAAVVALARFSGALSGAALFLGLGLTFGLLYLLRGPDRPLEWAWIPAVALVAFGLFVLAVAGDATYAALIWPLALVVAGVVLLVWNWRRSGRRLD